jgi:hypothetical protein
MPAETGTPLIRIRSEEYRSMRDRPTQLRFLFLLLLASCRSTGVGPSAVLSSDSVIQGFSFVECTSAVEINSGTGTIDALVPFGTDATSLTPTFELPPGATVDPALQVPHDFSGPVTVQVRAEDGSVRTYTVRVSVRSATALLVIDLQNAIFPVYDQDRFLENVGDLISRGAPDSLGHA